MCVCYVVNVTSFNLLTSIIQKQDLFSKILKILCRITISFFFFTIFFACWCFSGSCKINLWSWHWLRQFLFCCCSLLNFFLSIFFTMGSYFIYIFHHRKLSWANELVLFSFKLFNFIFFNSLFFHSFRAFIFLFL